ncbi:MAG: dihydropteroate synthase [Bacillota bacterium]
MGDLSRNFKIGDREFDKPLIMGILNVTPDSFSDGGKYYDTDLAVNHAVEMISAGADIIDVGGESTRPGSEFISEEEELRRIVPVVERLRQISPEIPISIDTTKKKVAYETLKRGAAIINDISGLTFDPSVADVVKEFNAGLIIMHIKGVPKTMQQNPEYFDLIKEVKEFLQRQIGIAEKSGLTNLIIDPGIGFGKSVNDNYRLIGNIKEFKTLGFPLLIGLSRKSFLGKSLALEVDQRDTSTAIAEAFAMSYGANIIRTHNVKNAVCARQIYQNISNAGLVKENV